MKKRILILVLILISTILSQGAAAINECKIEPPSSDECIFSMNPGGVEQSCIDHCVLYNCYCYWYDEPYMCKCGNENVPSAPEFSTYGIIAAAIIIGLIAFYIIRKRQ